MERIQLPKNFIEKELFEKLNKVKDAIDEDISRKIHINALAKEATLSEFHFYRSFKNAFGVSPHQYVLNKRLEKSVELLKDGKFKLTEIAYLVGFNDIYSFSKSFKKRFNTCPSQLLFCLLFLYFSYGSSSSFFTAPEFYVINN